MIAGDDPELYTWLTNAHRWGGDFIKALAEAGLRADAFNYALMRPLLLRMKEKYPAYLDERWTRDV